MCNIPVPTKHFSESAKIRFLNEVLKKVFDGETFYMYTKTANIINITHTLRQHRKYQIYLLRADKFHTNSSL